MRRITYCRAHHGAMMKAWRAWPSPIKKHQGQQPNYNHANAHLPQRPSLNRVHRKNIPALCAGMSVARQKTADAQEHYQARNARLVTGLSRGPHMDAGDACAAAHRQA